jgi:hypothetical protein
MRHLGPALSCVVLVSGLASCVKPSPVAPSPSAPDEWARATWEERHDPMTWVVLPNMARLFQAHDKTQFPELACVTCHGENAERVHYRMPATLPALDPRHMPTAETSAKAKFMIEEVTPTMQSLIGASTFGCFHCHPSRAGTP